MSDETRSNASWCAPNLLNPEPEHGIQTGETPARKKTRPQPWRPQLRSHPVIEILLAIAILVGLATTIVSIVECQKTEQGK
jgi:hypothetical protein